MYKKGGVIWKSKNKDLLEKYINQEIDQELFTNTLLDQTYNNGQ